MPIYAYITLLSTADYLDGVIALNNSLKMCNSKYPLHVILSSTIPELNTIKQTLTQHSITYILRPAIYPLTINQGPNVEFRFKNTFSKLHIFDLTQFDKIVYLDCDMIICQNIDDLFNRPHFSAVASGHSIDPINNNLNSGLLVLEPSRRLMRDILYYWKNYQNVTGDGGDQTLIQMYANHTYQWHDNNNLHLPETYNIHVPYIDNYLKKQNYQLIPFQPTTKPIKVLHYIGEFKPWYTKSTEFYQRFEQLTKCYQLFHQCCQYK